jgi:hypothetical protein
MVLNNMVTRDANRIALTGKFNLNASHWMIARLNEAKQKGYGDFLIDLTLCEVAFPDGLVAIAALIDAWRDLGMEFELLLPRNEPAAKLMLNCNFAHFVNPGAYQYNQVLLPRHVSIRRYETLKEQVAIVKEFVNVALNSLSLSRDVLQGMEWSLNEIMDNVLTHADARRGGFAQSTTLDDRVAFTVADCGRGILASLKEGFPGLRRDTDAIGEAVKAGVTRNPEIGQGNGLAGTLRVATLSGGSFAITSGKGIVTVFPRDQTTQSNGWEVPWYQAYPGTVVSAQIRRDAGFRISEALNFPDQIGGVLDVIETDYESEDGSSYILKISNEAPGFGSREAGKQIRTKIRNLLDADRSKAIMVDWEGVPVISSSFADEAFGKLFVDLGPIEFGARVRNTKMENLIRGLIDKAILQRTAQMMNLAAKSLPVSPPPSHIEEAPLPPEQEGER